MNETELKLVIGEDGLGALMSSELLTGEAPVTRLLATYYDTPKRKLARNGISLRLRCAAGKIMQTVKADAASSAGLFERSEWEQEVFSQKPVADPRTPIPHLLRGDMSRLKPAFTVDVDRYTWQLCRGASEMELTLDHGAARAGDKQCQISEAELEHRAGPVGDLFKLARDLDEISAIRVGVQTKAERGWLLVDTVPNAFKAEKVRLTDGSTAAEAFQRICLSCIRQFRLNEDLWLASRDSEALHQARVAIRRLRSALASFKRMIGQDEQTGKFAADLRWLAFELGEARNFDVLLERAEHEPLRVQLAAGRSAAYERVQTVLDSRRSRLLFLDLVDWLHGGDRQHGPEGLTFRDQPAREFAAEALDRLRRRMRKGQLALRGRDDEARHELRKDAKRLRYAAEFFVSLFCVKGEVRKRKRFLAALERLQDDLGALNDMAMAPEVLRKLDAPVERDALALGGGGEKAVLLESAAQALDELLATKPFWRRIH